MLLTCSVVWFGIGQGSAQVLVPDQALFCHCCVCPAVTKQHTLWYHADEVTENIDLATEDTEGRVQWLPVADAGEARRGGARRGGCSVCRWRMQACIKYRFHHASEGQRKQSIRVASDDGVTWMWSTCHSCCSVRGSVLQKALSVWRK